MTPKHRSDDDGTIKAVDGWVDEMCESPNPVVRRAARKIRAESVDDICQGAGGLMAMSENGWRRAALGASLLAVGLAFWLLGDPLETLAAALAGAALTLALTPPTQRGVKP